MTLAEATGTEARLLAALVEAERLRHQHREDPLVGPCYAQEVGIIEGALDLLHLHSFAVEQGDADAPAQGELVGAVAAFAAELPRLPPRRAASRARRLHTRAVTACRRAAPPPAARLNAPSPATPRQAPRARRRRSTGGRRPAAKASADDGAPGPHVVVSFGPVDQDSVGRLARLLIEQAIADILGPQHSDGPTVGAVEPSEEKAS